MYINTEYDLWPGDVSDIATVYIVELIRLKMLGLCAQSSLDKLGSYLTSLIDTYSKTKTVHSFNYTQDVASMWTMYP